MIAEVRALVAERLRDAPVAVHEFFPDDINEIPCIVVGRPSVNFDRGMHRVSLPVIAVGRRLATDDAQIELDALGDLLVLGLAEVPGLAARFSGLEPTVSSVAGTDHPSYTATLSVDHREC